MFSLSTLSGPPHQYLENKNHETQYSDSDSPLLVLLHFIWIGDQRLSLQWDFFEFTFAACG